ncbi:branched chain alpha-keto acid dehydrogenase E1 subunit beta [Ascodesmis nigricans]|uniref:3-methyl-2-oxobutanoate dehydrogenase (2-methylpropanoyl-transferring) n=1 Tax=Ascodesmis nigricans TaxID=341454 RepID=A0A4S2MUZ8_9PEZI|nr:branched chain alpha-keto acid dehydrogenase E1 subunit beta [Ascodesmis nigricans]
MSCLKLPQLQQLSRPTAGAFASQRTLLSRAVAGQRLYSSGGLSSKAELNLPFDYNHSSFLYKNSAAAQKALSLPPSTKTSKLNLHNALNNALAHLLETNPRSALFGEDVAFGGVFRVTSGLLDRFGPDRVFNTPLTEQGIIGFGVGLAAAGHLALPEIQFADYMFPGYDQLHSEASTWRFRSGGADWCNSGQLIVRMPCGAVGHGAMYHSQSPEGVFSNLQGVRTIMPRSPAQAKGLLLAAAECGDPVIFMEPKILYRAVLEEVPVEAYKIPIDKAEIVKEGKDITIVSYGAMMYTVEQAALHAEEKLGVSVEIIDLRTLKPWDKETVTQSVNKTGRLVVVHESGKTGGLGEGISAEITERCFLRMESPVKRVTGWDTHMSLAFEKFTLPDVARVFHAIKSSIEYGA